MARYRHGGRLKYEFHVVPGADATAIGMAYRGATGLSLARSGGLRVQTARGVLEDSAPVAYQRIGGRRVPVASRFTLRGRAGYGFAVGAYDHSRPLVIDPSIGYATFLGGPGAYDVAYGIKTDSDGDAYVVGSTTGGTDFPTKAGAYDPSENGSTDVFVSKLSPDGSSLLYSTFIGGTGQDEGRAIDIDSSGAAYVTGNTNGGFPTTTGAKQATYGGGNSDAFVAKLAPGGGTLSYSTYLGGSYYDQANGIAVDSTDHAYVTGYGDTGFPVTAGAFETAAQYNGDVFVSKLAADGKSLDYSTLLASDAGDSGQAVAVDSVGHAYVTGSTNNTNGNGKAFPTTSGAYQTAHGQFGDGDVFVTKLAPDGKTLAYSTLIGGSRGDIGYGIGIDSTGHAYVGGVSGGGNDATPQEYPTTTGAFDATHNGSSNDGFITKLAPDGKSLVYSTFLGGTLSSTSGTNAADAVTGLAVNANGQAYVTGYTNATDFPVTAGATQPARRANRGSSDVDESFATQVAADGKSLVYSTYFGAGIGQANEAAKALDVDPAGRIYIVGNDDGQMTPTADAFDKSGSGAYDAFVARLDPLPQCSDKVDNDGDAKIDYPDDPGCSSASDNSESPDPVVPAPSPQCSDKVDNDGDAKIDYPDDPGCSSASDNSESPDPVVPAPSPQCSDGLDNDLDGKVDYPNDPGCTSAADGSENPDPFVAAAVPGPAQSVVDKTKPTLGSLSLSSAVFAAARSGASAATAKRSKVGTQVSFSLSEAGSVKFTVERKTTGRKVGRKCKARTKKNAKKKSCTAWKAVKGSFTIAAKKGATTFKFTGRVGGRSLRRGGYRLDGTATDPAGNASVPKQKAFKIVK